jgi:hypothetical protein
MGMAKKKLFEIDKDSIVKATKGGYYYCTTTPPHPYGEKRDDRKKKYIYYHRALLEQKLGRYLKSEEQADHKDGNKEHNTSSNLVLLVRGPHQKSHAERGNHFWKKSPRNKPGRKGARNVLAKFIEGSGIFIEKWIPVKKLREPKKKQAQRVIAKFSEEKTAEILYQAFVSGREDPAYKKMPKLFPDYNSNQADDATDYLMRAFQKKHFNLSKGILKRVQNKILAGIT